MIRHRVLTWDKTTIPKTSIDKNESIDMTRNLSISLHHGGNIVVQTLHSEEELPFDGFGELLGLEVQRDPGCSPDTIIVLPGKMPEGAHLLHKGKITDLWFTSDWQSILVCCYQKRPRDPHLYKLYVWQTSLMMAGLNAILRGNKAVICHGALLETEGGGVVIFGESGMGKSTASRRWREKGCNAIADDMLLLEFSEDGREIAAHRLPTWSACFEGTNPGNYPVTKAIPVRNVLALGRSESGRDEIVELSTAQYFAQCYRSMFYWNLFYSDKLSDAMKQRLADATRQFAETISRNFPPHALLTVLDGDLRSVIENDLQTK